MAKQTKAIKFARLAQGIGNIRKGLRPMPRIRTDGSIGTKPCVPCPDLPEGEVTKLCIEWLKRHGCRIKRLNNAAGHLILPSGVIRDYQTYGIVGGGDFIGMFPDGRHFEVEFKKGKGGRQSRAQVEHMKWVLEGSGIYVIIHGIPECVEKLLPILKKCVDSGTSL